MEAVGQLTGGLAHDFNNLLAVIVGNTELVQEQLAGEHPPLDAVLRAAEQGAQLTQRLLAFSRRQPLSPSVIDLDRQISGMSDLLSRTLGETIKIETVVPPDLWNALADAGQVENALLNLVLNARDAMQNGGKLTIECANARLEDTRVVGGPEAKAGEYAMLSVSDVGIGMTAEVQAHAFEPFYTTKETGEGSGLGLSMVYGFAKQSEGHVTIESEEGCGTTVRLYLPRATQASEPRGANHRDTRPEGRGEKILLIEDNSEVRGLVVRMLETLGYCTVDVPDAASACNVLSSDERVDLVLSDVVLAGGISGPEFAQRTRRSHPDLKFVFMSGYVEEAAERDCLQVSDRVVLNKPFRQIQLARALRDVL